MTTIDGIFDGAFEWAGSDLEKDRQLHDVLVTVFFEEGDDVTLIRSRMFSGS